MVCMLERMGKVVQIHNLLLELANVDFISSIINYLELIFSLSFTLWGFGVLG